VASATKRWYHADRSAPRQATRDGVCFASVRDHRPDPTLAADVAYLAGAIERWAADLALAEEPARFLSALEAGAPPAGPISGR
jgi:hypothetical protein